MRIPPVAVATTLEVTGHFSAWWNSTPGGLPDGIGPGPVAQYLREVDVAVCWPPDRSLVLDYLTVSFSEYLDPATVNAWKGNVWH
jgi:hypothetical protein